MYRVPAIQFLLQMTVAALGCLWLLPACSRAATLDSYIEEALRNHPGLAAAEADRLAAGEQVLKAGVLPDPRLSYAGYLSPVETRVGPQRQALALSQALPWPGILDLRTESARAGVDLAGQNLRALRLNLVHRVTRAYADYWLLGRTIRNTEERLELLAEHAGAAETGYRNGTHGYSDLLEVQMRQARADEELARLNLSRPALQARLNSLLGRVRSAEHAWPEELPACDTLPAEKVLVERLRTANPELTALAAELQQNRARLGLSRREGLPALSLGLKWIQTDEAAMPGVEDSGKDPLLLNLALKIPVWRKAVKADVRRSELLLAKSRHRAEDRELELAAELERLLYAHREAGLTVELHERELIPRSEAVLEARRLDHATGRVDFEVLLRAVEQLLDQRLELDRARARLLDSRAALDALTGAGRLESTGAAGSSSMGSGGQEE